MQLPMRSCRFCEKVHHGEKKEMRRGPRDRTLISRVTSLMNGTRNPTGMMLYVCPLFSGDIKLTYQLANFISPIGKLPSSYVQVKLINSRYSRYQRDAYRDPNPYSTRGHATCRWRIDARRSTFRPCRSQEMGLVQVRQRLGYSIHHLYTIVALSTSLPVLFTECLSTHLVWPLLSKTHAHVYLSCRPWAMVN